jgi:hypothetical protein
MPHRSLFAALLSAACALAAPGASRADEPCACPDRRDLFNRIREANAAIGAYEAEIAKMDAAETRTGKPVMFSDAAYHGQLEPAVQQALDAVTDPAANKATGRTQTGDCKVVVDPLMKNNKPVTACLRKSIETHEGWHKLTCEDPLRIRPDYRTGMRLAEIARDEIQAYRAEITFALTQLESSLKTCTFVLELDSVIESAPFGSRGEAHASIPMTFDPGCNCFTGEGQLDYKTVPIPGGGDVYYQGAGSTRFQVTRAQIREDLSGRSVSLLFNFALTQERMMSRRRGASPVRGVGFWGANFVISRGTKPAADGGYLVTDWKFSGPKDPFYAEATLNGNCATNCVETTRLVVKQR